MSITQIKALIVMTSAYYQQQLPDHVVDMYAEDLSDIPMDRLKAAFLKVRRDPKVVRFPLPAHIRSIAEPVAVTDEQQALEAVSRIIVALGKYGHTNPAQAQEYIGSLGWEVVKREGGWLQVCERVTNDDLPIIRAQMREMAKSIIARSKAGTLNEAPGLPGPENNDQKLIGGNNE